MKRYTRKEIQSYLSQWRASGLSINQFCRGKGLKATTFHSWKNRLPIIHQELVEIPMQKIPTPSKAPLLLQKGSFSIKLTEDFNETLLLNVLRVLEQLHD